MPLYTFSCGTHKEESVAPRGAETTTCKCGKQATRVFSMYVASPRTSASEFRHTKAMRDAIAEASGYKQEAIQAKQEAESNGFK